MKPAITCWFLPSFGTYLLTYLLRFGAYKSLNIPCCPTQRSRSAVVALQVPAATRADEAAIVHSWRGMPTTVVTGAAGRLGGRIAAAIADFEEDNTFAESAAWVLDLAGMLLSRETASGAVDALVATMKVRISPRHFSPGYFPGFGFAPAAGLVSLMIHS